MLRITQLTTLILLTILSTALAQPQKGDIVAGAFSQVTPAFIPVSGLEITPNRLGFGYYTQKSSYTSPWGNGTSEYDVLGFNISPDIGYFITSQLVIGLHGTFLYSKTTDKEDESTSTLTITQIGPMVRYYIPTSGPFQFSIGGAYSYGDFATRYEEDGNEDKENNILTGFNLGVGGDYFVSPDVSLGVRLEYQRSQMKNDDGDVKAEDTVGGIGFRVGIQTFLGRKQGSE